MSAFPIVGDVNFNHLWCQPRFFPAVTVFPSANNKYLVGRLSLCKYFVSYQTVTSFSIHLVILALNNYGGCQIVIFLISLFVLYLLISILM